jgi:hypothetical protein
MGLFGSLVREALWHYLPSSRIFIAYVCKLGPNLQMSSSGAWQLAFGDGRRPASQGSIRFEQPNSSLTRFAYWKDYAHAASARMQGQSSSFQDMRVRPCTKECVVTPLAGCRDRRQSLYLGALVAFNVREEAVLCLSGM